MSLYLAPSTWNKKERRWKEYDGKFKIFNGPPTNLLFKLLLITSTCKLRLFFFFATVSKHERFTERKYEFCIWLVPHNQQTPSIGRITPPPPMEILRPNRHMCQSIITKWKIMKNEKYQNCPNSSKIQIVERDKVDTPDTQIHDD